MMLLLIWLKFLMAKLIWMRQETFLKLNLWLKLYMKLLLMMKERIRKNLLLLELFLRLGHRLSS